ncbi:hypothetical protein LOAG_17606 [Loa loa]|uniref:Uncharacterized protein n=1 Tax=Loa loa TaxID=7209 RepID=A0A1S0UHZ6_LOALO|nr:hypothetical protein LOAG_17606 [Loa loa]EJD75209.1 hypothetical protein LOAG_17606 [Loa loa]
MSQEFDWENFDTSQFLDTTISMSTSETPRVNTNNVVNNSRLEEFHPLTSTSTCYAMAQSSYADISNNRLEESVNLMNPLINVPLQHNSSTTIRDSTSTLTLLSYQTDGVTSASRLSSAAMPLMNALILPNSSQVMSTDDAMGHHKTTENDTEATTNVDGNFSPLWTSSRTSIRSRYLKRQNDSESRSAQDCNRFNVKRSAGSKIDQPNSNMELLSSNLIQQQPQSTDFASIPHLTESAPVQISQFSSSYVNDTFESVMSSDVHSDTLPIYLNDDDTSTTHAFQYQSEVDPYSTIQPSLSTDPLVIIPIFHGSSSESSLALLDGLLVLEYVSVEKGETCSLDTLSSLTVISRYGILLLTTVYEIGAME